MQEVIRYKANDGSEWDNREKAISRDQLLEDVNRIMSALRPTPRHCNWEGYVQQSPEVVDSVKRELFAVSNRDGVLKWWIEKQMSNHLKTEDDLIKSHPSWFHRFLDGSHGPLGIAYERLMCIDAQCREWNQPYFAANTPDGAQPALLNNETA